MNHIAHFLLAPRTGDGAIGTLLADFHRGAIAPALPAGIAEAIALHRRIDGETDRLVEVRALKAAFAPGLRRFAGVALGRLNVAFRRRFQREVDLRPLADELARLRPACDAAFAALFPHLQRLAGTTSQPFVQSDNNH